MISAGFAETLTFMIQDADKIAEWEHAYRAHRDAKRHLSSAASHTEAGLGRPLSHRTVAISCYSEGYSAEIRLGLLQVYGEMPFREFYRPGPKSEIRSDAEYRESVGIRVTGVETLLALKRAVDEAPPPRSWKQKTNKMSCDGEPS